MQVVRPTDMTTALKPAARDRSPGSGEYRLLSDATRLWSNEPVLDYGNPTHPTRGTSVLKLLEPLAMAHNR